MRSTDQDQCGGQHSQSRFGLVHSRLPRGLGECLKKEHGKSGSVGFLLGPNPTNTVLSEEKITCQRKKQKRWRLPTKRTYLPVFGIFSPFTGTIFRAPKNSKNRFLASPGAEIIADNLGRKIPSCPKTGHNILLRRGPQPPNPTSPSDHPSWHTSQNFQQWPISLKKQAVFHCSNHSGAYC